MAKQNLKDVVRGIVASQGNLFIRELLRDKGLPVSGSKTDFVTRLEEAVDAKNLTFEDVEEWLSSVEGWGNFHIYPFRIPTEVVASRRWRTAEVRRRLANIPARVWDAPTSQLFPDSLTLTHASFTARTLRLTWHQGSTWRQRDKGKDRVEEIDGDRYEFDAFLIRRERTVVRFQLSLDDAMGAVFIPYPQKDENHEVSRSSVWETVAGIVEREDLPSFDISGIIAAADRAQLRGTGSLRSKSSRLTIQDGYVEFGSIVDAPYGDIDPLREVRLAAGGAFSGHRATFFYTPPGAPERKLTVFLTGPRSRAWLPAKLDESQVWSLLAALAEFAE